MRKSFWYSVWYLFLVLSFCFRVGVGFVTGLDLVFFVFKGFII